MKTVVISRFIGTLCLFYLSLLETGAQNISGVINSYHRVTAINTGANSLTLNSAAGLSVGTRVLLIQMKGATIDQTNTANFGNISPASNIGNAGNYEFNVICGIAGNDVLLSRPFARSYTVAGAVQLVSIPYYNLATVTGTLTAGAWNSASGTGGILAIEADTILLNNNIDVSGLGFRGGGLVNYPQGAPSYYNCHALAPVDNYVMPLMPPGTAGGDQLYSAAPKGEGVADFIPNAEYARGKQANGGGGGNNHNAGGGGGGNYGMGGQGGTRSLESAFSCHGLGAGIPGLALSTFGYSVANNRIFLGGGGGAGHENNDVGMPGGAGGGIAIVSANVIVGSGTSILANGARPTNPALAIDPLSAGGDGGGGGGAGGVVILNINSVNGNIIASAQGGRGSDAGRTGNATDCPGSGGGGGGGVIWMKGGIAIANVAANTSPGSNGVGSPLSPNASCRNTTAGATAGAAGSSLLNYVKPMGTTAACAPLPVNELKSFTGSSTNNGNLLQWQMRHVDYITQFELERTTDQVRYITIATIRTNGKTNYSVTDAEKIAGTVYYRLKVVRPDNRIDYSYLVRINTHQPAEFQWLSMRPNPASQQVNLSVYMKQYGIVNISLFNGPSQPVLKQQLRMNAGYGNIIVTLDKLPAGIYWMVVEANGTRFVKALVKN